ncbi:YlbF family regulator [Paenibacillus oryzisoli]|uniref:RicAFT regulatory complex protein RicA family protein n=1 Tax=Paenibacillus oryzisoli TaxID=1850517 RepID=UPI003D2678AF
MSHCDHDHNDSQPHKYDIPEFTNTEMIVREDILVKAKELANLLTTSNEVQFYQKAEKQIAINTEIQTLISSIKKKQKEIVAFETFQNEKMVKKIEGEIEQLQDQLDEIPIVSEFKQTQEDINYLLQLVMSVVRDTISEKINVEAGATEAPSSCD